MNVDERSAWSEQFWTILRGLKETARYLAGRMNVARGLYERWATIMPDRVTSVVFVCKGNICRSPLAAAYFRSLVDKGNVPVTVRSAGLETTPGKSANRNAMTVAVSRRLSLDKHVTAQVHQELLDQSDLIIVMELAQKVRVYRLYPSARGKVVLLGYFDPKGQLEIADPYGKAIEQFESCFAQIIRCCDNLAKGLGLERGKPSSSGVSISSTEVT
jgi:protein-tyrosine phosphatase